MENKYFECKKSIFMIVSTRKSNRLINTTRCSVHLRVNISNDGPIMNISSSNTGESKCGIQFTVMRITVASGWDTVHQRSMTL